MVLAGLILVADARADELDVQQKALNIIKDAANSFCNDVPLVATQEGIELSGKARGELNAAISKIVNVGIEAAGSYKNSTSQRAVLEKDLVDALKNKDDCKLVVFNRLVDRLLPAAPKPPEHGASTESSEKRLVGITVEIQYVDRTEHVLAAKNFLTQQGAIVKLVPTDPQWADTITNNTVLYFAPEGIEDAKYIADELKPLIGTKGVKAGRGSTRNGLFVLGLR